MWLGFWILLVFVGCGINVIVLEMIVSECPGAGNIVTFAQFVLVALDGLIRTSKFFTVPNIIPVRKYAVLVTMFFVVSVVNNYALNFNIAMPLHMIFRSGSLIANMILGMIILHKRYDVTKYMSVLMITIGIVVCTLMSANTVTAPKGPARNESLLLSNSAAPSAAAEPSHNAAYEFVRWLIGLAMLVFALLFSARMGIYQEVLYQEYGKQIDESLFFNHALPLPLFAILTSDIYRHALLFNESEPMMLGDVNILIPRLWFLLLLNIVTQYFCIRSVFILTVECSSLQVTLVITLRKFISLLFSIWFFQNPFTLFHWLGTALVFGGTLMFTDTVQRCVAFFRPTPSAKAKKVD